MIRNVALGLVFCIVFIVALLLCLGFGPRELARFYDQPYAVALQEGKYLDGMTVWLPGREVPGTITATLEVRNPTPVPLELVASWENLPEGCSITPEDVHISVPSGQASTQQVTLQVTQPEGQDRQVVSTFRPPTLKGVWKWAAPSAGSGEAGDVPLERGLVLRQHFGTTNYAVLFLYLGAMLVMGWWCGRGIIGARSFFTADGKMNFVVVGLSLLGTYLSALTMMGLPGMSYGAHDWTYMAQLPCLLVTAMVITGLVLPRYREAGIISVYEYLERRIHVSARLAGSICFVLFAIGRMGLVLYLPALAFSTVTQTPLWLAIIVMGTVITAYTVLGGMKAVIWTDAIQVVIFIIGAFVTLGFIFSDLGAGRFMDIAIEHNKFRVLIPEFDPKKIVTLWLVMETIFQTIRIYGTQQDMTQRYLATPSVRDANRSVWIAILGYIPLGFIFYFLGTALFAFYKAHPAVNLPGTADPMYPHFILNHLPAGVAGLVIAAIFAAAMSSIDSCMNSCSTVCVEDFWRRFSRKEESDRHYLRLARRLTVCWGLAAVAMALAFMKIKYAQIVWGKVMGISTNGMLGLMALAFLPIRINKWAAGLGFVTSYVVLFLMMGTGVNFLLWPVVGNLTCFFVALFLSPLFTAAEKQTS